MALITSKWEWLHFHTASQTCRFSMIKSVWFCFFKFFVHISCHQITKGHGYTENHCLEPVPWGTGFSWEGWMCASGFLLQSWYTGLTLPVGTSCRAACNTCVSTELCLQGMYECVTLHKEGDEGGRKQLQLPQPLRNTPKHSSACLEEAGTCSSGRDSSQFTFSFNEHHQTETGFLF